MQCQDKEFCKIELPNIPMDAELWIRDDLTVDMLVAVGRTAQVFKFDFRNWSSALITTFNLPSPVCSAAFNHNADMLVCGSEDNLIYQLDAESQNVLGEFVNSLLSFVSILRCFLFSISFMYLRVV